MSLSGISVPGIIIMPMQKATIAYKNDIRIKNKKVKLTFLIAGIISFILLTFYELSAVFFPIRAFVNYYMFLIKNPLLHAVPTVLLYLGLIKK